MTYINTIIRIPELVSDSYRLRGFCLEKVRIKMTGLTEGRIVHYVMPDGQHRPAIIVRVWNRGTNTNGYSNLLVFLDGTNDRTPQNGISEAAAQSCTMWATSVTMSEGKEPRTWHWPEKV